MLNRSGRFSVALLLSLPMLLTSASLSSASWRNNKPTRGRAAGGDVGHAKVPVRGTKIRFPRLTRLGDREVMRRVNRQIYEVAREFDCGETEGNSYFNVRSAVEYVEYDVFSIYATAEYYCGGAYPTNDANSSMTFDLRTGEQVKFAALFKDYEQNYEEILRVIFAKQIARSEKLVASGKPKEDSCEGDFDLYSIERLQSSTFAFNFSKAGLKVQPEWPHVIEACAELVTVPYKDLKKFAAPEGLLARVAK